MISGQNLGVTVVTEMDYPRTDHGKLGASALFHNGQHSWLQVLSGALRASRPWFPYPFLEARSTSDFNHFIATPAVEIVVFSAIRTLDR